MLLWILSFGKFLFAGNSENRFHSSDCGKGQDEFCHPRPTSTGCCKCYLQLSIRIAKTSWRQWSSCRTSSCFRMFQCQLSLLNLLLYSSCNSSKLLLRQLARSKERDTLIQNEIESKEEFLRSMAMVFQDFDQNGNGAISWTDSCPQLLCLAFTYLYEWCAFHDVSWVWACPASEINDKNTLVNWQLSITRPRELDSLMVRISNSKEFELALEDERMLAFLASMGFLAKNVQDMHHRPWC